MAVLQVDLSDPADMRTGIDILTRQLNIGAHRTPADPTQPLMETMMEMKHREIWRFLFQVANLEVPEYSLPELGEHLGKSSNKIGSLKAILAKPEQRLGVQFFEPAPSRAVDAAGNPRYRMPGAIKRAIQAAANNIETVRDLIMQCKDFAHLSIRACNELTRTMENTVWVLRRRILGKDNSDFRFQSQILEFLDRHPRLVKAVKHIFELHADRASAMYFPVGTSSAMLFLMAASKSDAQKYREAGHAETALDMTRWEKACEFWTALAQGAPEVEDLLNVRRLPKRDGDKAGKYVFVKHSLGDVSEMMGAIIKAWGHFLVGEKVTAKNCELKYSRHQDFDGTLYQELAEFPTIGGIDLGESAFSHRLP